MSRDRFAHHTSTVRFIGVLLLAMTVAFVAGRVTVPRVAAPGSDPARPVATQAGAASPAPWSEQRFRDHDTVDDICTDPICNG